MRSKFLFLSFLAAGLLSACSSSDSDVSKEATGNMSIGVSLLSVGTRVTETADTDNGLVTAWESTDKLNIFHKYAKTGSTASMIGLEFKNSSSAGSSTTTFVYDGTEDGYSFNPGNNLYVFNKLSIANNYTVTYRSSTDDFLIGLNGFDSEDGTIGCLRNYDAMYSISSVADNGVPGSMTMKHYPSVIRFDLFNAAFSTLVTKVVFTCENASSSILPSSASFSLDKNGTIANEVLQCNTSWTVSNVAVSSGVASVYLMTFPFQGMNGKLTITATNSDGSIYSRQITLSNFSLASGQVKAYKVTLNATELSFALKYYMWDASGEYVPNTSDYNKITSGVATNSCAGCPTYDQIQMYLGAGVYWDNTIKWKDTSTGTDYTGGLWLKKKQNIAGFDAGTATKATWTAPISGTPSNTADYFFLPASGNNYYTATGQGSGGRYWSSTPYNDGVKAYRLYFDNWGAFVNDPDNRSAGFCLWTVQ
jgi:hypothetical protein